MRYFTSKYAFGIFALFLVVGIAVYFFFSIPEDEATAYVSVSGLRSTFDLYKDYGTWASSTTQASPTHAEWLHTMASPGGEVATTFADVNGDGLADILVHQDYVLVNGNPITYHFYYGILLNQGDLTFDHEYKCVYENISGEGDVFYGDCAQ